MECVRPVHSNVGWVNFLRQCRIRYVLCQMVFGLDVGFDAVKAIEGLAGNLYLKYTTCTKLSSQNSCAAAKITIQLVKHLHASHQAVALQKILLGKHYGCL